MGSMRPVAPNSLAEKVLLPDVVSLKAIALEETEVRVAPRPNSIAMEPAVLLLACDFHCTRSAVILYSAHAFKVPPPKDGVWPDGPKVR